MLRLVFVLVCCAIGSAAAIHSAFGALLFYVWFALFRPQEWLWVDVTAFRPSLVLGLMLLGRSLAAGVFPNLTHPLSIGAVLFLLFGLIAQPGAVNAEIGWYWLGFMAKLVLVTLFLVTLTNTRRRVVMLLTVVSASLGFFTAKAGLASILSGGLRFGAGLAGAFVDNNGYAIGAAMALYLLIASAQNSESKWMRRALWVAVPLTVMTVVSTFSRGGFLALCCSGMFFLFLQRRRWVALALAVVAVPVMLLVVPIPEGYFDRLRTIRTYDEAGEVSALSRLHFWHVALRIAADRPFGIGLWNFQSVYDTYDDLHGEYGSKRAVHNSYLQALTEVGWLGAAVFGALFVYAFAVCFRMRRRARLPGISPQDARFLLTVAGGLMGSMSAFLVGGMFMSMAYNDITWLTFGIIAAADRVSASMVAEAASEAAEAVAARAPAMHGELDRMWTVGTERY